MKLFQEIAKKATKRKEVKPAKVYNNIAAIKNAVVKNRPGTVKFSNGTSLDVEADDANAILAAYARLTPENKKKMEDHLTKGVGGVMKLIKFCRQV